MSLRGNLADFPVTEVLQLLALQEKTGTLRLYGEKKRVALVFTSGKIVSTWDRTQTSVDPLKQKIIDKDLIPEHLVLKALRLEARAEYPFIDILLREGMISVENFADAMHEHIEETVQELLRWEKGRFDFAPEDEIMTYVPDCAVKVESILLEAVQKIDERKAAGMKRVFPRIPAKIGPAALNKPIELSARNVMLHGIVLVALPLIGFIGSLMLTPSTDTFVQPILGNRVAEYNHERGMRNLRIVLEMYSAIHERYPATLNELVDEGLLSTDQHSMLKNQEINYRALENGASYFLSTRNYEPLVRALPPEDDLSPAQVSSPPVAVGAR